jgi:hypothetical protein
MNAIAKEAMDRGVILTRRGKQMAAKEAKRLRAKGWDPKDAWLLAEKRVRSTRRAPCSTTLLALA